MNPTMRTQMIETVQGKLRGMLFTVDTDPITGKAEEGFGKGHYAHLAEFESKKLIEMLDLLK